MSERPRAAGLVAIAFLILLAAIRVASTYRVFSQTVDEPIHIASGLRLLTTGRYDLDVEHPPLARLLFAAGAALGGAKADPAADRVEQGNQVLYRDGSYRHNLAQSRAGNLPFFIAAAIVVAVWSKRLAGWPAALIAVALFASLPPVLGHAGLATTDMSVTATTAIALLLFWRWLVAPAWTNALALSAAVGAGLVSKFSFPVFFGAGAVVTLVLWVLNKKRDAVRARRLFAQVFVIAAVCIAIVWTSYGFSTATVNEWRATVFPKDDPRNVAARYDAVPGYEWVRPDTIERYWAYGRYAERQGVRGVDFVDWAKRAGYPSPLAGRSGDTMRGAPAIAPLTAPEKFLEPFRRATAWFDSHVPLPATQFATGILYVKRHSAIGHPSYFLGEYRDKGWWDYFPLLFLFKTPIAFTLLAMTGTALLLRRGIRERDGEAMAVAVVPVAMFVPAMASGINIGLRHILPVYPLLTVSTAYAVCELWRSARARRAAAAGSMRVSIIVLLVWYFVGTTAAHPDYLAYFNGLAGRHPERIAADSNLDWGQDLLRLERVARRKPIDRLHLAYFGSAVWTETATQVEPLEPNRCTTGWVAISETIVKQGGPDHRGTGFQWLDRFPYEEVGRSIRLYQVPEGACAPLRLKT